jgi:hypothetical protein
VKAKRLIPAALIIILVAIGGLLFFNTPPAALPTLVFKGYDSSATNGSVIANLELRNTTHRAIWLNYSGSESPFGPEFLEKPTVVPPKLTNGTETNHYSLRAGSFFLFGKKVLPGDSVRLEFPLRSGESAKLVGVTYYLGRFSDGNDFLSHLWRPYLDSKAPWKDKAAFYWQRFRGRFKAPERHEIWCKDLLSFQEGITNSLPK